MTSEVIESNFDHHPVNQSIALSALLLCLEHPRDGDSNAFPFLPVSHTSFHSDGPCNQKNFHGQMHVPMGKSLKLLAVLCIYTNYQINVKET